MEKEQSQIRHTLLRGVRIGKVEGVWEGFLEEEVPKLAFQAIVGAECKRLETGSSRLASGAEEMDSPSEACRRNMENTRVGM